MAPLRLLLLVSAVLPLAHCYPFSPPTCYSKVLSMAREATQWASYLKRAYETVSPHPGSAFSYTASQRLCCFYCMAECCMLNFNPSTRLSFRFNRVSFVHRWLLRFCRCALMPFDTLLCHFYI